MQRYGLRMLHCVVCERGDASLLVSASLLRVDNLAKAKYRGILRNQQEALFVDRQ